MRTRLSLHVVAAAAIVVVMSAAVTASDFQGTARVGYIYVDDEGNQGVYQPTYNLYEGGTLSLDNASYLFDNGIRLYGDLENITLNNRNLRAGMSKSGLFGVTFRNNQYRRTYSYSGDRFTRRNQTYGQVWVQPVEYLKFFGGIGYVNKHGDMVDLYEPVTGDPVNAIDYTHTSYNMGVTARKDQNVATFEFRRSLFTDDQIPLVNDRNTTRLRLTASAPLPWYKNVIFNAGAQRYEHKVENRDDTLTANTFWGGARFYYGSGWSLRYSFIWDRARRTTDIVSTDNITNAVYADKVFAGFAGLTLGYQHRINDDVRAELSTDGYFASGWIRPIPELTFKAGLGSQNKDLESGRTLTGGFDYARYWASAKYKHPYGSLRVKVEDKQRENEDIGTEVDFFRVGTDMVFDWSRFGRVMASFAYDNGAYHDTEGSFKFEEYILSGDALSATYYKAQAGFGAVYMRSRRDVDVESFTLRFTGIYHFMDKHSVEVIYSVYNFDNFADPSPVYQEYYTANVVQVNLIHEF